MAATYYMSHGNLVIPALIHGIYDATGFLGVATSMSIGLALRAVFIIIGLILAIIYLHRRNRPV
jgi:hypothetical protein